MKYVVGCACTVRVIPEKHCKSPNSATNEARKDFTNRVRTNEKDLRNKHGAMLRVS